MRNGLWYTHKRQRLAPQMQAADFITIGFYRKPAMTQKNYCTEIRAIQTARKAAPKD